MLHNDDTNSQKKIRRQEAGSWKPPFLVLLINKKNWTSKRHDTCIYLHYPIAFVPSAIKLPVLLFERDWECRFKNIHHL